MNWNSNSHHFEFRVSTIITIYRLINNRWRVTLFTTEYLQMILSGADLNIEVVFIRN